MHILIATGGSGGHIFPAIETAKVLRLRGHRVSFAGVLGSAKSQIQALDFPVFLVAAEGFKDTSFLGILRFIWVMAAALGRSWTLVRTLKPDKIIGFGGYGGFPVVMAGVLRCCPVMIHEQNVMPGKANAFLASIVKKVAISFEASRAYFNSQKVVWTGCPCHQGVLSSPATARLAFGLQAHKRTILLLGGSQGSQRLNAVFFELMRELSLEDFQAIHMTGVKEYPVYQARYSAENMPVKAYSFISNITESYAAADIVIARAGAATVSELGLLGLAAVLVPYPFAGNHQKYNAAVLTDTQTAEMIEQKNLNKDSLKEALMRVLSLNMSRQACLCQTQHLFQKEAALQLALVAEGL